MRKRSRKTKKMRMPMMRMRGMKRTTRTKINLWTMKMTKHLFPSKRMTMVSYIHLLLGELADNS